MLTSITRPDLRVSVVKVTPDEARAWLNRNENNRNPKPAKITQYARDMREGNWRMTGEPIKFDDDGVLLDGQNRLAAVIEANRDVELMIVTGIDASAQEVMDSGARRSNADALAMHGFRSASLLAPVASTHYMYLQGTMRHCMTVNFPSDRPTSAATIDHLAEHPGLIEATSIADSIRREHRLAIGAIGTAVYEFHKIDSVAADEFFDRFVNMRTTGAGDPILTLLRRTRRNQENRTRVRAATDLFMLIRSWNAHRAGESLSQFVLGSEGKWTPMPVPR